MCRFDRELLPPFIHLPADSSRQADGYPAAPVRVAAGRLGSVVACVSVEQTRLRRCPALGQRDGLRGDGLCLQVGEYLLDDRGVFDAGESANRPSMACGPRLDPIGDDPDGAAALATGFDVT